MVRALISAGQIDFFSVFTIPEAPHFTIDLTLDIHLLDLHSRFNCTVTIIHRNGYQKIHEEVSATKVGRCA